MYSQRAWRVMKTASPILAPAPSPALILKSNFRPGPSQQSRSFLFFFGRGKSPFNRLKKWAARPTFYYEVGGVSLLVGGFYVANLETIPFSGRKRFNLISPEIERQLGKREYQSLLQQFKNQLLPESAPEVKAVKRVLKQLLIGLERLQQSQDLNSDKLVVNAQDQSLDEWDVHVIDSPIPNAFVIPGNKVFIFTGILQICKDDNGIATVLGHEISHNLCHHIAEGMSSSFIRLLGMAFLFFLLGYYDPSISLLGDVIFSNPRSRRQESEADQVGLDLMALSCFDPRHAQQFWTRMSQMADNNLPGILSTHPTNAQRINDIEGWTETAVHKYKSADCSRTKHILSEFMPIISLM